MFPSLLTRGALVRRQTSLSVTTCPFVARTGLVEQKRWKVEVFGKDRGKPELNADNILGMVADLGKEFF
jgi:hypothetical protein